MNKDYQIRKMTRRDLDIAFDWMAKEGWNPGLHDAEAFYAVDPKGFFMGFINNEPISCISAVAHDKNFGFLGLYIVKPEYRGRGYGWQVWQKAVNYLKTQNIGLDGVIAQQENYKKSGFKIAYRHIRYQGLSKKYKKPPRKVVSLLDFPFTKVLEYDRKFFPAPRPKFLAKWIKLPESISLAVKQNGKLAGYSVVRKCQQGYKIGPLFANNQKIAESIMIEINNRLKPNSIYFLDVPEINKEGIRMAKNYKMKYVFETARMYTKDPPNLPTEKIFGVTSFELG